MSALLTNITPGTSKRASFFLALGLGGSLVATSATAQTWITWDGSSPGTRPDVVLDPSSSEQFTQFSVTLHGFYIEEVQDSITVLKYHRILIPEPVGHLPFNVPFDPALESGLVGNTEVGRPLLPRTSEDVGVVTSASSLTLDLLNVSDFFTINTFGSDSIRVLPTPPSQADCDCCDSAFTVDQAFYDTSTTFFPSTDVEASSIESWMSLKVGRVQLNLTQYNPRTKALRVMKSVTARFGHSGSLLTGSNAPDTSDELDSMFAHVINYNKVKNFFNRLTRRAMLFIVRSEFVDEIEPLRQAKVADSLKVSLVSVIQTGPPNLGQIFGDSLSVKSVIDTFYASSRGVAAPVNVLIVGDVDRIKGKRWQMRHLKGKPRFTTDKPYAIITADNVPDLHVARLSADNAVQVTNMVRKVLRYEKNPLDGNWVKNVILAASADKADFKLDYFQNQCNAKKTADASAFGHTVTLAPGRNLAVAEACGPVARVGNAFVTAGLNSGRGILGYRGHGETNKWHGWTQVGPADWDIGNVTDPALLNGCANPLVFAICCLNGQYDNGGNDGIGETWMQIGDKKGAVFHYGSSPESDTEINMRLTDEIYGGIYSTLTTIGLITARAEKDNIREFRLGAATGSTDGHDNVMAYQLFGDPDMRVRKLPAAPPTVPPPMLKDITCLKAGKPCEDVDRYNVGKAAARLSFKFRNPTTMEEVVLTNACTGFAVDRIGRKDVLLTARYCMQLPGFDLKEVRAEFGAEYDNGNPNKNCQTGGPNCSPPTNNCAGNVIVGRAFYIDPACEWGLVLLQGNAPAAIPLSAADGTRDQSVFVPQHANGACKVISDGAVTEPTFPPSLCQFGHSADTGPASGGAPVVLDEEGINHHKVVGIHTDAGSFCTDRRGIRVSNLLRLSNGGTGPAVIDSVIAALDTQRTGVAAVEPSATTLFIPTLAADDGDVTIRFAIAGAPTRVRLAIYDVSGRLVRLLDEGMREPRAYTLTWDRRNESGTRVARGIYLVNLVAGDVSEARKIVLTRD